MMIVERVNGWMDKYMVDEWMGRWVEGWVDEWRDEGMEEWMSEGKDKITRLSVCLPF